MAHVSHYTPSAPAIAQLISKPFVAIGNFMVSMAEANTRSQKLQQLMDLSDAQLAERGLKRDNLVHHVFSDSYYI